MQGGLTYCYRQKHCRNHFPVVQNGIWYSALIYVVCNVNWTLQYCSFMVCLCQIVRSKNDDKGGFIYDGYDVHSKWKFGQRNRSGYITRVNLDWTFNGLIFTYFENGMATIRKQTSCFLNAIDEQEKCINVSPDLPSTFAQHHLFSEKSK